MKTSHRASDNTSRHIGPAGFIILSLFVSFWPNLIAPVSSETSPPMTMTAASPASQTAGQKTHRPQLSDDELAALTVYLEARGESFAGKLAVAAVIRNRMKHRYFSDGTVKDTVLRYRQFQPWNTRRPEDIPMSAYKDKIKDSLLAWRLVQDGRHVVEGALHFYNPKLVKTPRWAPVSQKVATIGDHEFYMPPRREI